MKHEMHSCTGFVKPSTESWFVSTNCISVIKSCRYSSILSVFYTTVNPNDKRISWKRVNNFATMGQNCVCELLNKGSPPMFDCMAIDWVSTYPEISTVEMAFFTEAAIPKWWHMILQKCSVPGIVQVPSSVLGSFGRCGCNALKRASSMAKATWGILKSEVHAPSPRDKYTSLSSISESKLSSLASSLSLTHGHMFIYSGLYPPSLRPVRQRHFWF